MDKTNDENNPEVLKERGNQAVKESKFDEAVLHYTFAIKLDPTNYALYSNRSYAFLKVQQYYFAMEDANETIKLNPKWAKGYFRKGEIEFATGHYSDACNSYRQALQLKPDDINLLEQFNRAAKEILKERKADEMIPWVGAGIGIVIGVIIVISDCLYTLKPTHPVLMACITIIVAILGFGVAKMYRMYLRYRRNGLLDPPIDLMGENKDEEKEETKSHQSNRYTKSQARQRYKKGKL